MTKEKAAWILSAFVVFETCIGESYAADQRLILLGTIWQPYNAYSYLAKSTFFFLLVNDCTMHTSAWQGNCSFWRAIISFFLVCPRRMGLSMMSKKASSNFKTWHFRSKYSVAFTFQFPSSTAPWVLQDCYSNIIFANHYFEIYCMNKRWLKEERVVGE